MVEMFDAPSIGMRCARSRAGPHRTRARNVWRSLRGRLLAGRVVEPFSPMQQSVRTRTPGKTPGKSTGFISIIQLIMAEWAVYAAPMPL